MLDFGVFYTCYTETKAVDFSITKLLDIYPECPIYLVSDGGSDYSFLNSKTEKIVTLIERDTRGFIPFLEKNSFRSEENQKKIKESILTFLDRVERAIDYCNKELLLVMEPDVLVRGDLNFFPRDAHLLGSRINVGLSNDLRNVVKSQPGSIDVNCWGATTAFLRCSTFKEAHRLLKNNSDLLDALCKSDHRLANYDVLFAVIFALVGKEEAFNPEIIECFRDKFWSLKSNPLVHQFREHYPKKSDGYNGSHTKHPHGLGDRRT